MISAVALRRQASLLPTNICLWFYNAGYISLADGSEISKGNTQIHDPSNPPDFPRQISKSLFKSGCVRRGMHLKGSTLKNASFAPILCSGRRFHYRSWSTLSSRRSRCMGYQVPLSIGDSTGNYLLFLRGSCFRLAAFRVCRINHHRSSN